MSSVAMAQKYQRVLKLALALGLTVRGFQPTIDPKIVRAHRLRGVPTLAPPPCPEPQLREVEFDDLTVGDEIRIRYNLDGSADKNAECWVSGEVKYKSELKVIVEVKVDADCRATEEYTKDEWQKQNALVRGECASPRQSAHQKDVFKHGCHQRVLDLQKEHKLVYRAYANPGCLAQDLENLAGLESSRRCRTDYDIVSASVQTVRGLHSQTGDPTCVDKGGCGILIDWKKLSEVRFACVGDGRVKNMWNPDDRFSGAPKEVGGGGGRAEWDKKPKKWDEKAKAKRAFQERVDAIVDGVDDIVDGCVEQELKTGNDGPRVMFGRCKGMLELTEGQTDAGSMRKVLLDNNFFGGDKKGFTAEEMVKYLGSKTDLDYTVNELCITLTKNALLGVWADPDQLEKILDAKEDGTGWHATMEVLLNREIPVFKRKPGQAKLEYVCVPTKNNEPLPSAS